MASFKETITKAIGNSEIFNKTADFLSDKQKRFKAQQALDDANAKLTALYLELGKTVYKKRPLSPGRTSTVIREEIAFTLAEVEKLQMDVDDLNNPKTETTASAEEATQTSETSDDTKTE